MEKEMFRVRYLDGGKEHGFILWAYSIQQAKCYFQNNYDFKIKGVDKIYVY